MDLKKMYGSRMISKLRYSVRRPPVWIPMLHSKTYVSIIDTLGLDKRSLEANAFDIFPSGATPMRIKRTYLDRV